MMLPVGGSRFAAGKTANAGLGPRVLFLCLAGIFVVSKIGHKLNALPASAVIDDRTDGDEEFCGNGESADGTALPQCDDLHLFHSWSKPGDGAGVPQKSDSAITAGDVVLAHDTDADLATLLEKTPAEDTPGVTTPATPHHGLRGSPRDTSQSADTLSSQDSTDAPSPAPQENATDSGDSWAASVKHLMHDMEEVRRTRRMAHKTLDDRIARHIARLHETVAVASARAASVGDGPLPSHETAWSHDLAALQQKLQARSKTLKEMHQHHISTYHNDTVVATTVSSDAPIDVARAQADQTSSSQGKLSTELDHWLEVRREASNLAASLASIGGEHGAALGSITDMAQDLVHLQAELERKLRDRNAARHASPTGTQPEPGAASGLPSRRLRGRQAAKDKGAVSTPHELVWEKAASWKTASRSDKALATVQRSALHGASWSGKIPKVACIAVVPRGSRGAAWLKYFVDNFRLQHYEGERQLFLIHHQDDHKTKHLVDQHADGNMIKSGEVSGAEPLSTVAFRYGAFLALSSGADVIARWDFGGWYHPARLATQVHALALTGRPACLLGSWTFSDGKENQHRVASEGNRYDATIVGVAAWMRRHWYPTVDGTRDATGLSEKDLVVVHEAAELAVYSDEGEL